MEKSANVTELSVSMEPLDIQDYLDATSDASSRTRKVILALVVTSVLLFVALLNSLRSNWMLERIKAFRSPGYRAGKLGNFPTEKAFTGDTVNYRIARELYKSSFDAFTQSLIKSYVDNSLTIKVPFFGINFDINDLGLLGGLGLTIVLVLLRFCLSREVNNLELSFDEAIKLNRLKEFYILLAMRQVLTVPTTNHIKRTKFLVVAPKVICWFPFMVYCTLVYHDMKATNTIGEQLNSFRFIFLGYAEYFFAIIIFWLTSMITKRLYRMDKIWEKYYNKIWHTNTVNSHSC